jgi:hypothetical protein
MPDWFNAISNIVGLAAFVLSIPGYIAMWNSTAQRWMSDRKAIPILLSLLLGALVIIDVVARSGVWQPRLEAVSNKTYDNEVVTIDGKDFFNCTFINPTIRWNGGPYNIERVKIMNGYRFDTEDPKINRTLSLLNSLHAFAPNVDLGKH